MNKKIDNAYLKQYTDNAIKRGYEIYDEWIDKKHGSRKIVASAESAVKLFKKRKTMTAFIDALAYLFALDTHIKEKYNNILHCLFSYFSWRRETRAFGSLKGELNIPLGETDIRNAIAVMIEKLAEKLEKDIDDEEEDDTHGGKRNGKAEDEAATEEKEIEETSEETPEVEELDEKEEKQKDPEEKGEEPIEEVPQEETKEDKAEKNETAEPQQEESEVTKTYEKEELVQENNSKPKEENNVSDVESEPTTDKKEEAKNYNDIVDFVPLEEKTVRERPTKQTSFIDEMVIDNMVKGDKNIIGYRRIDEEERNKTADILQDTVASRDEKNKSTDKDDYLYDDKMIETDKGEAQQTLNVESAKQAQTSSETKIEQPQGTVQNNDKVNSTKQEIGPPNDMLKSGNLKADPNNHIADALNAHMSLESKMALIRMQEDQMREHISITLEELGMNETPEVLRVSEPYAVNTPSAVQNSK